MAKNPLRKASNIARRLNGVTIGTVGASWTPPIDQRERVRAFMTFLEDRRVLYNPQWLEVERQVTDSVGQIREACSAALSDLPEDSHAAGPVRAIRAACRRFLDEGMRPDFPHMGRRMPMHGHDDGPGFFTALGEFRATVGLHVAILAVEYGLDVEGGLKTILPEADVS
jgi:hypothetical protein